METSSNGEQSQSTNPPTPHTINSGDSGFQGVVKATPFITPKAASDPGTSHQKHVSFIETPVEGEQKREKEVDTGKSSLGAQKTDCEQKGEMRFGQSKPSNISHGTKTSSNSQSTVSTRTGGDGYSSSTFNHVSELNTGRYKKGLNAKFLRHNPRFINEPICHVLPNEISASVGDCMQWGDVEVKGQCETQRKM